MCGAAWVSHGNPGRPAKDRTWRSPGNDQSLSGWVYPLGWHPAARSQRGPAGNQQSNGA